MIENRQFILDLREKRMSLRNIGKLLGVSKQRIWQIINPTKLIPAYEHKILTKKKRIFLGLPSDNVNYISGGRDQFRELVRIRDNHTCQICFKKWKKGQRRLDVHHQDEKQEGTSHKRGMCRMDKENFAKLITLCHKCHLNLDSVRRKIRDGQKNAQTKTKKLSTVPEKCDALAKL